MYTMVHAQHLPFTPADAALVTTFPSTSTLDMTDDVQKDNCLPEPPPDALND